MTIEQALVQKLGADGQLAALAPGGVWLDVAPAGVAEPFVVVSLQAHEDTVTMGEVLAFEEADVLVKAVGSGTSGTAALAAADRVQALLHGGTLTITAGTLMSMTRSERVRYVEVDGDTRYQHAGGVYTVVVSR